MTEMPLTPWRYAGGGQVYGRDGRQIAYVAARMQAYDDTAIGNTIAKAWLIPDLAEALRELLSLLPSNYVGWRQTGDQREEACEARCRAVLAKLDAQP